MWYVTIMLNIVNIVQTAETDTRADISAGVVHDTKYLFVIHFFMHFFRGGTCHKVSFRQQEFTL